MALLQLQRERCPVNCGCQLMQQLSSPQVQPCTDCRPRHSPAMAKAGHQLFWGSHKVSHLMEKGVAEKRPCQRCPIEAQSDRSAVCSREPACVYMMAWRHLVRADTRWVAVAQGPREQSCHAAESLSLSVPVSARMCAAADAILTSSQCGVLVPNISTLCSMLPSAMTFVGTAKFRIWHT